MNWSAKDLAEYTRRRRKHEQPARVKMQDKYANRNSSELYSAKPQPDHGSALDSSLPRETPRVSGASPRFKITLVVRCLRPRDWDNNCCKFLQDQLIKAGIIPGDGWNILQGQVISLKAKSREEEGTTVIVETI